MPTSKRAAAQPAASAPNTPPASRPVLPPEYGIPTDEQGLLPWSHVEERLTAAKVFWVAVVSPQGRPHCMPVDGIWLEGALYFGGDPRTRRQRYLKTNNAASVHLENGYDVVTMNGDVELAPTLPRAIGEILERASKAKYGYSASADEYVARGSAIFRPREVFAWKAFPQDVTRWRIPG